MYEDQDFHGIICTRNDVRCICSFIGMLLVDLPARGAYLFTG